MSIRPICHGFCAAFFAFVLPCASTVHLVHGEETEINGATQLGSTQLGSLPQRLPMATARRSVPVIRTAVRTASAEQQLIPFKVDTSIPGVELNRTSNRVTLVTTGADLSSVLRMIAEQHQLNLVVAPDVSGLVNVSIREATLEEVLDSILGVSGFRWHRSGNLLYVTAGTTNASNPKMQGRIVRVYPLNYVASSDIENVANGLLTSVGSAFVSQSSPTDQMRTRETLVVDDVPESHDRIAQYLAAVDVPPRQVLIESHILQVALTDEDRHGINFQNLMRVDGARIQLQGTGFAEDQQGPSVAFRVDGTDMDTFIELLRSHTQSRTLASPKLSVVNRQEARIQIGQRLPYTVATTTQTMTVQSVEFLEVGIVLTVTPIITDDGHVLMTVLPKVSGGKITENGFPEEETTEVSTTVLMPSGGGLIIGGLIREDEIHSHSFIPYINKIPLLGKLFQRHADTRRRNELVVALVTHILPEHCPVRPHEAKELCTTLPEYAASALTHTPPTIWNAGSVTETVVPKDLVIAEESDLMLESPAILVPYEVDDLSQGSSGLPR